MGPNYVGQGASQEQLDAAAHYAPVSRLAPAAPSRLPVGKWVGSAGVVIGAALAIYVLINFLLNVLKVNDTSGDSFEEMGEGFMMMIGSLYSILLLLLAVLMMGLGYVARRLAP